MTVWSQLQSWISAAASDVALDNEFKNIYLGLNEAANGNLPSGYNKVELTFTGASLTIKGETKMSALNVPLDSTLTVTGAAGWRYIVTTNGGVMSVESIPGAEITADTQVYTPTPVFNTSANGYYSTVNTTRRIVGVCYFDATNIKKVIAYGIGKNRNDDYWRGLCDGALSATGANERLQFIQPFGIAHGSNISIVDNGQGTTDANGARITLGANGSITIGGVISCLTSAGSFGEIYINKNGVFFDKIAGVNNSNAATVTNTNQFSFQDFCQDGDYYTIYTGSSGGTFSATIVNLWAKLDV